jgi:hypothetical protein
MAAEVQMYMVDIFLPEYINPEMMRIIPAQRQRIDELLQEGKIGSYSLSMDRTRLWVLCYGQNESEVVATIKSMPIFDFIRYRIFPLMFHNTLSQFLPAISPN